MWRTIFLCCVTLSLAAPFEDLVKSLPQIGKITGYEMYSGYLDIPNSNGKELHYVLVTSQNNPQTDPVILWLNGGPGCSSMDGLFYEHGPYVFPANSTQLIKNQWSWNTNASVIYLESPAGVGFSILGNASNKTNDVMTAHDNLQALISFYKKFPELVDNELYITGESYAGIFVPTFAYNVLLYNEYASDTKINLQGIAVGNGCTDWKVDTTPAFMQEAWTHSLIWWEYYEKLMENCDNMENYNSQSCANVVNDIQNNLLVNLNIYDIYGKCYFHGSNQEFLDNQMRLRFLTEPDHKGGVVPPCATWKGAYAYLRNTSVIEALHVEKAPNAWALCTNKLDYRINYEKGSIWVYPYLMNSGIRILIYSGDVDGAVPTVGTREWINNLRKQGIISIKQHYSQWHYDPTLADKQVAGWHEDYDRLTFVTVRGAGHMVPQDKPDIAHKMIYTFINNESFS